MKTIALFLVMLLSGVDIVEAKSTETVNCKNKTTNNLSHEVRHDR